MLKFGTYRSIVMKSLDPKAAKNGLRSLAKNTLHVNQSKAIVGLSIGTTAIIDALSAYVIGEQLNPEIKAAASVAMVQAGHNLIALARTLKLKTPTATKKVKLVGTITAALLGLNKQATNLLQYVDGVFEGPVMTSVEKEIVIPATGAKEVRTVSIIDTAAETLNEQLRQDAIKPFVEAYMDIFWRLSYALLGTAPDQLFEIDQNQLLLKHPEWTPVEKPVGEKKAEEPVPAVA